MIKKPIVIVALIVAIVGIAVVIYFQNISPENEQRTFNSAEGAPEGSLHNLPVPKPVNEVKKIVAERQNINTDQVVVMQVEEQEWSDGCLGLATEGEMCTQAIIPGYRITAEAEGENYIFRTDQEGSSIREE
jgi:hypothetical protein